jgi:Ca2+-binding RTX toxin-like protein
MAIFKINVDTSVFTSTPGESAFAADFPGPDTLIVDPNAYLISTNGDGAFLATNGAWTVTVNGSIVSQIGAGISLEAGNASVSTINVGVGGEVIGALFGVVLGSSANLNNAGEISGTNFGVMVGDLGQHTITNSGTIVGPIMDIIGRSNETVRNSGIINGTVDLSGGDDKVTNFAVVGDVIKSGTITGTISLGSGNDKFAGGANSETVQDGDGADTYSLGGGNDWYIATGNFGGDETDVVKGGAGIDTYDAGGAISPTFINLDTVAHDLGPIFPGAGLVAANTATGANIAGSAKDAIFGFENATGGGDADIIYGSAGGNTLFGGGSRDLLFGFGGNDKLNGGVGSDRLFGGAGKDELTGGPDPDAFLYAKLSDSGITAGTRDLIADFEQGSDLIDLHLIDANTTNAAGTNDTFTFIGTNAPFTGTPGQLRTFWSAFGQIIEGDVNGDKKADFSIEIADPTHAITLTSGSFFL